MRCAELQAQWYRTEGDRASGVSEGSPCTQGNQEAKRGCVLMAINAPAVLNHCVSWLLLLPVGFKPDSLQLQGCSDSLGASCQMLLLTPDMLLLWNHLIWQCCLCNSYIKVLQLSRQRS